MFLDPGPRDLPDIETDVEAFGHEHFTEAGEGMLNRLHQIDTEFPGHLTQLIAYVPFNESCRFRYQYPEPFSLLTNCTIYVNL